MNLRLAQAGFSIATALVVAAFPLPAAAALITSASQIGAPSKTVTFDEFSGFEGIGIQPVATQVGTSVGEDITVTGNGVAVFLRDVFMGLGTNGVWGTIDPNGRGTWISIGGGENGFGGGYIFTFADPVSAVGMFMNYEPTPNHIGLTAFGTNLQIVEQYIVSNVAPIAVGSSYNAGGFRGIARPTPDIRAFGVGGAFLSTDDLQFARVGAVPEPETCALLLAGLTLLGFRAARRTLRRIT